MRVETAVAGLAAAGLVGVVLVGSVVVAVRPASLTGTSGWPSEPDKGSVGVHQSAVAVGPR